MEVADWSAMTSNSFVLKGARNGQAAVDAPRMDIEVRDGFITRVQPASEAQPSAGDLPFVDGRGLIVFPGFVNAHAHSTESFEQGAYDGDALEAWLAMAYPPLGEEVLPARWHYLRAMLLAMQCLRSGVTSLHDDFLNPSCDSEALEQVLDAYRDIGIGARVAVTMADRGYLEGMPLADAYWPAPLRAALAERRPREFASQASFFQDAMAQVESRGESRLRLSLGPRGPQRCSPAMLGAVDELARRHAVPVHMHVLESRTQALTAQSQYGKTFIRVLDEAGLLNAGLALNHAVWLTADDIALIAERGARVVHNPLSNFKLASGLCPVKALRAAGVEVALGTDGAATGDSVDFLDTLRMAALVHKLDASDALPAPTAPELVSMATRAGAATMGAAGEYGEIAVGQRADLTLFDARDLSFLPLNDPQRQLCYAATSRAVHTVIVDGRVVYAQGRCTLIDEAALREEIAEGAEAFRRMRTAREGDAGPAMLAPLRNMLAASRARSHTLETVNRISLP
jgi:5-methylthioadenosine/S-adenosylhomocysteine deaminase